MSHLLPIFQRRQPNSQGLPRAMLLALGAALMLCLLQGCAYRITIQQGNFLDEELINQVEMQMSRKQVQFLLGTPMIEDPFHAERWDYLYYVISGRRRRVEQGHFVVYFEDDRVSSVERFADPKG
ncbi:MAG: outer membrane protein assembly factor BamE [Pseudomonadota bacterium]